MDSLRKRPGKVTFLGIAMIVLGGLAVVNRLTEVPALISAVSTEAPAKLPNLRPGEIPDGNALHHALAKESAAYYPVKFTTIFSSMALGIGLFICGLGVLKMMPIARTGGLILFPLALILSLATNGYEASLVPAMQRTMAQMIQPEQGQGPAPPADLIATILNVTFYATIGISLLFSLVINLVLFFLLLSAKSAFYSSEAPPLPDEETEQRRPKRSRYDGYDDDYPSGASSSETGITDLS